MAQPMLYSGGEHECGVVGSQLAQIQSGWGTPITVEALATVIDPQEIAQVLRETNTQSKRRRKLPAELVMWLVVGMALFRDLSIMNVLHRLVRGLGMPLLWKQTPRKAPTSKAVTKARDRLGYEAVRVLFRRLAALFRSKHAGQNRWRGHDLYSIDGTTFTTPDTEDNESHFGRPGASRGSAGYPQLRGTLLVALWSHIVVAAAFGPYKVGELTNAAGDWRAVLRIPKHLRPKARAGLLPETLEVRLIRYQRKGYRVAYLVTSLLDPKAYPAEELVLLYHGRWEIELCYAEVKTRFVKERVVFRCERHKRVLQEAYGLLIAYNCVRVLMARAAQAADVVPRQLS